MWLVRAFTTFVRLVVALWHVLGWFGFTAAITSIAVAVGGALAAMAQNVSPAIAIMAAFCVFVGGAYLTILPALFKALTLLPRAAEISPANHHIWKHVQHLKVREAACLWVDQEPWKPGQERDEVLAWERVLIDALHRGELEIVPKGQWDSNDTAGFMSTVPRDALRKWAKDRGHDPAFLREAT